MIAARDISFWLATGFLIAVAWYALARLCPARNRGSTHSMLHFCTLGMFVGLAVDANDGHVATLAALCMSGSRSLPYWIHLHWNQLPAMHAGMMLGTALVLPFGHIGPLWSIAQRGTRMNLHSLFFEALRTVVCGALMLTGMDVGALLSRLVTDRTQSVLIMIAGMTLGMVWGLVLGVAVLRALTPAVRNPASLEHERCRSRPPTPRRQLMPSCAPLSRQ